MPANNQPTQFPAPTEPYSLKEMVKKLIDDEGYAQFIHGQMVKARAGDRDAAATLQSHFKPEDAELAALNLSEGDFGGLKPDCPGTTHTMLLDFAAVYHRFGATNVNCP
jgi:hypothetical protein